MYSEIIPVVSFATLSYMPFFFLVGGGGSLRNEINEICTCSSLILSTCFTSETTQTGFDFTYSHIGVVHKILSGEFDFGPYQACDKRRGTHFELFILSSPNWLIVNVYSLKTSRFHDCVRTQTGRLGYDTTQTGT